MKQNMGKRNFAFSDQTISKREWISDPVLFSAKEIVENEWNVAPTSLKLKSNVTINAEMLKIMGLFRFIAKILLFFAFSVYFRIKGKLSS